MAERVTLTEWEELTDQLTRFAGGAETTVDDDRIRIEFDTAHFEVRRDGTVDAGMPLHEFERSGATEFVVDHAAHTITVSDDESEYTFTHPGA